MEQYSKPLTIIISVIGGTIGSFIWIFSTNFANNIIGRVYVGHPDSYFGSVFLRYSVLYGSEALKTGIAILLALALPSLIAGSIKTVNKNIAPYILSITFILFSHIHGHLLMGFSFLDIALMSPREVTIPLALLFSIFICFIMTKLPGKIIA